MKYLMVLLLLCLTCGVEAQSDRNMPATAPELARELPELLHRNPTDFGPLSDAFDKAVKKDPASVDAAVPILADDLSDPDPDVQFKTLGLLYGIELTRADCSVLYAPVYPHLVKVISSGGPYAQTMALLVAAGLRWRAPDLLVQPIEKLIQSRPTMDKVRSASVGALMSIRGNDDVAQSIVLDLLSDTTLSVGVRAGLLQDAAMAGGGPKIVDYVVEQANAAADPMMRDSAFSAATSIGLRALDRIHDRLDAVAKDPATTPEERQIALHALSVRASLMAR